MEKAFSIATAAGLPLQCSLSGVLAPGAKGGLKYSVSDVSVFLFQKVVSFYIESILTLSFICWFFGLNTD